MSARAPTRPDEYNKREQCFRCPERARISWGRATRGQVRGRDLSLSRSGQRYIDAPWPRKFNQGPYVPEHVLETGDQSRLRAASNSSTMRRPSGKRQPSRPA